MQTNASPKEEDSNEIAFKDFKGAISTKEFKAIIAMAEEEYLFLEKIVEERVKFQGSVEIGIDQIKNQSSQMPPGLAEKLIDGLKRRAIKEVESEYSKQIDRHMEVVDFLNRFRLSDDMLPYLDFNNQ